MPLSRSVGDGVFELRFTLGPTARRILPVHEGRVAEALGRHLIVSFPEKVPAKLEDAVQVA
jgi:hypothetical protein